MPKPIDKHLSKDVLGELDPDIIDVIIKGGFEKYLRVQLQYGQFITLTEDDLLSLLNFLRKNK